MSEEDATKNPVKTYSNNRKTKPTVILIKREQLTTKKAVELLLNGTIKTRVCRYCLYVTDALSGLDQTLQIAGPGALYKVTVKDVVASVHPFKVTVDPNFPNKICEKCLDKAIRSYLFAQQCDQSERALRNCFDDLFDKVEKLDPIERVKKRGRQKLHPNHNILHTENKYVINYAEPLQHLINISAVSLTKEPMMSDLECKRCWQVLPNVESLVNHEKIHPKTMWFHCRLCGQSFAKKYKMSRHLRTHAKDKKTELIEEETGFVCKQCGHCSDNYNIHLQHIEKHKFQTVLQHLVERKMDKLCTVCLDKKDGRMVNLDKVICLHGGYPELTGDRTLYNILGSTIPEMNILHNHTGTKICEKCLDHAIISYIFINRVHYIRHRLDLCVTKMVECLKDVNPDNKLFIEIAQNGIMPIQDTFNEDLLLEANEVDESKLNQEFLEDEFRLKSDSDSESDDKSNIQNNVKDYTATDKKKLLNGFKEDNLNEFLTFKTKGKEKKPKVKHSCPLCRKKFITEYFLRKHILKHAFKKTICKLCDSKYKSKFHLREHVKSTHILKLKLSISCDTCGRTFKTEEKKLSHEKQHLKITCDFCFKTFATQYHFNNHMLRHFRKLNRSKKNIQTCSFCEKECKSDNELSIHVNKTHLQIKPYACDMCDRQFYTEFDLRCHKKIHNQYCKEKCEFCSKIFKCRRNLVIHVRTHLGVKPYQCQLCPETFYSEFKVKYHMRKWHGGSFCCKLCRKVFVNKKGLKDHVNGAHSFF